VPPRQILRQNAPNSISDGASLQAPLEELTTLYSAPPDPLAVFKGPTSNGGRRGRGIEGEEKEVESRGGEGGEGWPPIGESGSASERLG